MEDSLRFSLFAAMIRLFLMADARHGVPMRAAKHDLLIEVPIMPSSHMQR